MLKYIVIVSFILVSCGDTPQASFDVMKQKIEDKIVEAIGKGDVAVQKYKNKIEETKDSLVQIKVNKRKFIDIIDSRRGKVQRLETSNGNATKIKILKETIVEMERGVEQLKIAEKNVEKALGKMIANLDIVRLKIDLLETKKSMLVAIASSQALVGFETDSESLGNDVEATISDLKRDEYEVEAQMEVQEIVSKYK